MLSLKHSQSRIHRQTKAIKKKKKFGRDVLIPPRDDTLIASHHNMWFATDFVPCYTWMRNCLQTLIISYISRELSSPSSQTPQLAAAAIPTFLTPLKRFTLFGIVPPILMYNTLHLIRSIFLDEGLGIFLLIMYLSISISWNIIE